MMQAGTSVIHRHFKWYTSFSWWKIGLNQNLVPVESLRRSFYNDVLNKLGSAENLMDV